MPRPQGVCRLYWPHEKPAPSPRLMDGPPLPPLQRLSVKAALLGAHTPKHICQNKQQSSDLTGVAFSRGHLLPAGTRGLLTACPPTPLPQPQPPPSRQLSLQPLHWAAMQPAPGPQSLAPCPPCLTMAASWPAELPPCGTLCPQHPPSRQEPHKLYLMPRGSPLHPQCTGKGGPSGEAHRG